MKSAASSVTVRELAQLYLDSLALRVQCGAFSENQRKRVEFHLAEFLKVFGNHGAQARTNSDLVRWLLLHPTWKSDATKWAAIHDVIGCFRWAADERLLSHCPYRSPKALRLRPRPRQPITEDEYRRLMAFARRSGRSGSTLFRFAVWFLRNTGCRTTEMRLLLWSDVDFEAGAVRLEHHKTEVATGSARLIGLDDRVVRVLRWMQRRRVPSDGRQCKCEGFNRRAHRRDDHVFINGSTGQRHGPWNKDALAHIFSRYANAAGLPKGRTAYCLRHLFCVRGIENGLSTRAIADSLGHKTEKMVSWYGRGSRQNISHLREVARIANGRKAPNDAKRIEAVTLELAP